MVLNDFGGFYNSSDFIRITVHTPTVNYGFSGENAFNSVPAKALNAEVIGIKAEHLEECPEWDPWIVIECRLDEELYDGYYF